MQNVLHTLCSGASEILLHYYKTGLVRYDKKDAGFVTEADLASEKYLVEQIKRRYPDSAILAEEVGNVAGGDSLQWFIDPLDGTTNFSKGIPYFGVALAVAKAGRVFCGAFFTPCTGDFYFAELNGGAFRNGSRIIVGKEEDFSRSVIATGDSYRRDGIFEQALRNYNTVYSRCFAMRMLGTASLSLCWLACGLIDGYYMEDDTNPWDTAPGMLLVREAGGLVTDFSGDAFLPQERSSLVAGNVTIAGELSRLLK